MGIWERSQCSATELGQTIRSVLSPNGLATGLGKRGAVLREPGTYGFGGFSQGLEGPGAAHGVDEGNQGA